MKDTYLENIVKNTYKKSFFTYGSFIVSNTDQAAFNLLLLCNSLFWSEYV